MDRSTTFGLIAFMSAFLSAVGIYCYISACAKDILIHQKSQGLFDQSDRFGARLLRNGLPVFKPLSQKLLRITWIKKLIDASIEVLIPERFITSRYALCSLVFPLMTLVVLLGWLIGGSLIVGLIMLGGAIAAIVSYLNFKKEKLTESIRESIPDALRSMSVCSHVGFSMQQTFYQVAAEIDEPLSGLFKKATYDLEAGQSIDVALQRFRKSSDVSELVFISVALDVQHRAGGSLRQVLDAARDSVESELELKRKLRVQTAQAKLSARIVSLMPFVLIAVFSLLSPGFLDPFFQSLAGILLLGIAILMQLGGVLMVRRMLNIEVG